MITYNGYSILNWSALNLSLWDRRQYIISWFWEKAFKQQLGACVKPCVTTLRLRMGVSFHKTLAIIYIYSSDNNLTWYEKRRIKRIVAYGIVMRTKIDSPVIMLKRVNHWHVIKLIKLIVNWKQSWFINILVLRWWQSCHLWRLFPDDLVSDSSEIAHLSKQSRLYYII